MRIAAAAAILGLAVSPVAAEPVRVVAFGTSLTAAEQWQNEVAARLADCAEVSIATIAQAGANSDWAVTALPQVVAARPEIVLVEFSANDASLLHGVAAETSRANTAAIIEAVEAAGARPVLMTMNPAHGLRALSRPWLGDYYELYRDIARERGVALIDLAPIWQARSDLADAIPDGVHPTDAAARDVVAPAVAAALRPLLCP